MGLFDSITRVAAAVAKTPILATTSGALHLSISPGALQTPAGAGAAIGAVGKVVDAAQGLVGNAAQQASAKRVLAQTVAQAQRGNPGAVAGVAAMRAALKAKALAGRKTGTLPAVGRRVITTTGTPLSGGWHIARSGQITVLH